MSESAHRYICIHSHFYQPPRENPWTESIDYQSSAYPFHDWNERISAECYAPNGLSQILDSKGWVVQLTNNYARISFNFGPTLLSWLEENDPDTYQAILEGDKKSQDLYEGHGSAIAQSYNHIIMPLANRRDKETQIVWGIRDFESRFQRLPESLWLAETAVDLETLDIMAANGMNYVILAPRQAHRVRPVDQSKEWTVVNDSIDPKRPYLCRLPSGRSIHIFFYDGGISQAVAFEGLLHNGEHFARRLMEGFEPQRTAPQLLHIATDGETYGHHHRHGDMALAFAMDYIEREKLARVVNYGYFLEKYPPQQEVEIHENSSWSCVHGVERWRADCGCNSGMRRGWRQAWRQPLREALDDLRDRLTASYEGLVSELGIDPWEVRNQYIDLILDRSESGRQEFWAKAELGQLSAENQSRLLKALELQRHLMLMYTSCGWFFDEVSGIETVQNMQYAYRAIELGENLFSSDLESEFKERLATCPSNIKQFHNARRVFEQYVLPSRMGFLKLAAHHAVWSLFYEKSLDRFHSFEIEEVNSLNKALGKSKMRMAHAVLNSRITLESVRICYCALHLGDHNVSVGVSYYQSEQVYMVMQEEMVAAFNRADITSLVRLLDRHFVNGIFSLKDLLGDIQKEITSHVLDKTLEDVEGQFRQIYEQHYPLMSFLSSQKIPLPLVFRHIAEFVQNVGIQNVLHEEYPDVNGIERYFEEAQSWGVDIDHAGLSRKFSKVLGESVHRLKDNSSDLDTLKTVARLARLSSELPFDVELGPAQNAYFLWYQKMDDDDVILENEEWADEFKSLGVALRVKI